MQILDVDLNNEKAFDNSFALKTGNTFIVNRSGQMLVNFGDLKPPGSVETGLPGTYNATDGTPVGSPLVGSGLFSCLEAIRSLVMSHSINILTKAVTQYDSGNG